MRRSPTAYSLLGLPRSAATVQVRARYRQLLRSYRKELPLDQLLEEERARAWTRAYLLLTDLPARRQYDRVLRQGRGRAELPDTIAALSTPGLLLLEAELGFVRGKYKQALERARDALKLDPRNARGWALAGDILRRQGKTDDALAMYNYALQYDPNNQLYWHSLNELAAVKEGRPAPRSYYQRPTLFDRPRWVWVVVSCAIAAVAASGVAVGLRPGPPSLFALPKNLLLLGALDGFLLGLVLAVTRVLGSFDDELVWYEVAVHGTATVPLGLYVIFPGLIFFWAAPIFYAAIAALDEYLSPSILLALAAAALATAGFSFAAAERQTAFLLIGGNFIYFGLLAGWFAGSLRRRVFEH
jgi:hypothetical protein